MLLKKRISIVFCLKHYKQYNLVTQIAIADLIKCYGHRLKTLDREKIINAINIIYPTRNLILDVLFSKYTIYNSFLLKCDNKHIPNYMEQKDIIFYLGEQLYDLGEEKMREGIDNYAKNSIYNDSIMQTLYICGINYVELYIKLRTSKEINDKMQDFVNSLSKSFETNTVYKSYAIQYALHLIIKKAFFIKVPEWIEHSLFRLIPNYQGMYRLFKCRDIQPNSHLYDKKNVCEPFLKYDEGEYILIGCTEKRKYITYDQVSYIFGYQGIVRECSEENKNPFQEYIVTSIEKETQYELSNNLGALIDFRQTLDLELENEDYLWPGVEISKLLNLHIKFDFFNRRYVAVNQENNIIFIMKKWSSSYNGNSDYNGNAIPLYSGTKLYIKKDYISILEQKFGKLKIKTYIKSYKQKY